MRESALLGVSEAARVDFMLEVGAISEWLTVSERQTQVEIEQGRVSGRIDTLQLKELPLNGRNLYNLVALQSGIGGRGISSALERAVPATTRSRAKQRHRHMPAAGARRRTTSRSKRDIDVIKAVRAAAGPKVKVLADSNNGFQTDFEGAWRLMGGTQNANLYWMEELFPEDVAQYTELRARMEKAGMKTLIADGENIKHPISTSRISSRAA